MKFEHLFQSYQMRGLTLKNRLIAAPCERNYGNIDGSMTQRYIDYLVERAKGGVGLINIESIYVDPVGRGHIRQLGLYDDSLIPGYRKMCDAVHAHGAALASHLVHAGRETSAGVNGLQPVAPSNVPCTLFSEENIPRVLTIEEIKEIVDSFGEAARRSVEAGFDVIEIHGAHGYLINQFVSPFSNKRTDEYGGTFEKRMRFPLEIVDKIRSIVGDDVPVTYRLSADEKIEGGLTVDDSVIFSQELEKAGVDMIDVSAGIYESVIWIAQPGDFKQGVLVDMGEKIKKNINIPVSIVGRINNPQLAEEILAAGKADFISLGRPLHADPYWPNKAEEGREEDIRMCPACMDCSDQLGTMLPISCAINPAMGREAEFAIKEAETKKKVAVIGAGPGGMEAARVASLRGHAVTLFEKEDRTGGQLYYATKSPQKQEYGEVVRYLDRQVRNLDIDLRLNTEITIEKLAEIKPDAVIVATGAKPSKPFTPGADLPNVYNALEVLNGDVKLQGKTVIMGAGLVGLETALFLVENGVKPVLIIEPMADIGGAIGLRAGWNIREAVTVSEDIEIRTGTTIEKISENSVLIQRAGKTENIDARNVIVSVGMRNDNELAEALMAAQSFEQVMSIGDCNQPRAVKFAIEEANIAARAI